MEKIAKAHVRSGVICRDSVLGRTLTAPDTSPPRLPPMWTRAMFCYIAEAFYGARRTRKGGRPGVTSVNTTQWGRRW